MPFKSLQEAFDALHEEDVENILKADAASQGIPWSEYCYRNGIMGDAQKRRVSRHEIQFDPDRFIEEKEGKDEF